MGTHSLIIMRVKNQTTKVFDIHCILYQQFDGNPEVVGAQLCRLLSELKMINGIPLGEKGSFANGAGCLFAQIVSYFKLEAGGAYLENPFDYQLQEWNYYVDVDQSNGSQSNVTITVENQDTMLFCGSVKDCQTKFSMNPKVQSPKEEFTHRQSVLRKFNL